MSLRIHSVMFENYEHISILFNIQSGPNTVFPVMGVSCDDYGILNCNEAIQVLLQCYQSISNFIAGIQIVLSSQTLIIPCNLSTELFL